MSRGMQQPHSRQSSATKKSNPLRDLIETEKAYVDLLAGVIRKVAAAWSRSNLPPPELDTMFRGIEKIYRANRSMLAKLKEIGTNPSSPKALGDLLIRWINDLEEPYAAYCANFLVGFDTWTPVEANDGVRTKLAIFSASNPPPLPPSSPAHPSEPLLWTLDSLFLLPKDRLKYYRKLYTRLLKSSVPGRSDHKLLSGALEKLETLITTLERRMDERVGANDPPPPSPSPASPESPESPEDEVVIDMPDSTTPGDRASTATMSNPIADLERRLSTTRTLDIFTMRLKQVRLRMAPSTLLYTREVRFSADVVIKLTPTSTGVEVVQDRGHVYILTDLLLICEKMTQQERGPQRAGGPDMWLLYPPLAGKHLRVAPLESTKTALVVTVLRKESVVLHADSPETRNKLLAELGSCIAAATEHRFNGNMSPPQRTLSPPNNVSSYPSSGSQYNSARSIEVSGNALVAENMSRPKAESHTQRPAPAAYPPRSSSASAQGHGSVQVSRGPSFRVGQVVPMQAFVPGARPFQPYGSSQGPPLQQPHYERGQAPQPHGTGPGQAPPAHTGNDLRDPPQATDTTRAPPETIRYEQARLQRQVVPPNASSSELRVPPPHVDAGHVVPPELGVGPQSTPPDIRNMRQIPPVSHQLPLSRAPSGSSQVRPPAPPAQQMAACPAPFTPRSHRAPPDSSFQGGLRKSASVHSLGSQSQHDTVSIASTPPMPAYPGDLPLPRRNFAPRIGSSGSLGSNSGQRLPQQPLLPSAQMSLRSVSTAASFQDPSPPGSPVEETPRPPAGPTSTTITAQMKCKVFLKQQHGQWKSLGTSNLKLYRQSPTNVKQLVVEADNKDKTLLVSTIVLVDGVERVGKTGVAVEISDKGKRSGIIYMIQLRNEQSAASLFDSLLAGSDRSAGIRS
ncbi:hypothetical protein WOLCODRAFT_86998 [Wolfiporia cocos MD-104 SS10]|uniref:DH domain-containing protein n=1 Tax=Wolfiporia cocos (strain MD-104) TaxID=742152 RepID=A0A2H3JCT7_WOLCO|nr:hypothetical protein WOLCODRAFT_86998 [Wolfiporia cocos MD-104 SS10]